MQTNDFKTKTVFQDYASPGSDDRYVIGLDIGYSGVKVFCCNKYTCFPSYARKIDSNRLNLKEPEPSDIYYRDEDGEWVVGNLAYNEVNASEIVDSEQELYSRTRYYSPLFKVITRVGIGVACIINQFGNVNGKRIQVQGGLPPKYLKNDTPDVCSVISGHHEFSLKIGRGGWMDFNIDIDEKDVFMMQQPLAALISAAIDKRGQQTKEARNYFNSRELIVIDPGFGTFDTFLLQFGHPVNNGETFPGLGMREVFQRTCNELNEVYGKDVSVAELQNLLSTGEIKVFDKKQMKRKTYKFDGTLEKNCKKVCSDAIEKMKSVYNHFENTDYIIAAGGTFDAWKEDFVSTFKDMDELEVIPSNCNDLSIPNTFSVARGLYYYRLNARA